MRKLISSFLFFCIIVFLLLAYSCDGNHRDENKLPAKEEIDERMSEVNIALLKYDEQDIQDFIDRYGWDMKETGSGLRYEIYHEGEGDKARQGLTAFINYDIRLLTGDLVYSSEDEGVKSFRIGRGAVESGLEEGILLMRVGDKARFIMPPHLAHGLPGDGVKIPKRVPIIYNVELINLL